MQVTEKSKLQYALNFTKNQGYNLVLLPAFLDCKLLSTILRIKSLRSEVCSTSCRL